MYGLDTRKLTGPARLLYAGAKATRDGFEIKLQDQARGLENVAKHLGMFKPEHAPATTVQFIIERTERSRHRIIEHDPD